MKRREREREECWEGKRRRENDKRKRSRQKRRDAPHSHRAAGRHISLKTNLFHIRMGLRELACYSATCPVLEADGKSE